MSVGDADQFDHFLAARDCELLDRPDSRCVELVVKSLLFEARPLLCLDNAAEGAERDGRVRVVRAR